MYIYRCKYEVLFDKYLVILHLLFFVHVEFPNGLLLENVHALDPNAMLEMSAHTVSLTSVLNTNYSAVRSICNCVTLLELDYQFLD